MSGILNQFLIGGGGGGGSGVNNYFFATPVYFKSLTGKALDRSSLIDWSENGFINWMGPICTRLICF
jgi:hypothetical protein